jgi:hypothetical protein
MGAVMKSSITELAAAWIVAVALIAAMAVDVLLPKTPPSLGRGVAVIGTQRPVVNSPASITPADPDLPLMEFGGRSGAPADDGTSATAPRHPNSGSNMIYGRLSRANG